MQKRAVSYNPKTKPVATPVKERPRKTSHVRPKSHDRWDDDTDQVVLHRNAEVAQDKQTTVTGFASPLPAQNSSELLSNTSLNDGLAQSLTNTRSHLPPPAPLFRGKPPPIPSATPEKTPTPSVNTIAIITLAIVVVLMVAALARTMITTV